MESHPIENLMKTTLENIKEMVDVDTIVGDPILSDDGTTILPISKVSFGFASGGTEFPPNMTNNKNDKNNSSDVNTNYPFGGGSGAGVTIKPVAFLTIKGDCIKLLPLDHRNSCDRIIDSIPQIIEMIKKKKNNSNNNINNSKNSCNTNNNENNNNNSENNSYC